MENFKTRTRKLRMTVSFTQDALMIYESYTQAERQNVNNFLTNLNITRDSIKFDQEKTTHSIVFFDTLIYIDKNGQLLTTLHVKSTNSHNYFHQRSSQTKHL